MGVDEDVPRSHISLLLHYLWESSETDIITVGKEPTESFAMAASEDELE